MSLELKLPVKSGLFVTGTDTEVGKTLITGAVARILAGQGLKVGVFKPVATGCRHSREGLVSSDAEFLAVCADSDYPLTVINPVSYATPAAPVVAADYEKRGIDFEPIASAYRYLCEVSDVVLVEGIGGVRVPVTDDVDVLDMAVWFGLPVVVVARAGLGTINHTLLTVDAARRAGLKAAGVVLNGYSEATAGTAEVTNPQVIARYGKVDVLSVVPYDETVSIETGKIGEAVLQSLAECDWRGLCGVHR